MDKYKIFKRREPILVGHKLQRIGSIFYEVAIWDGQNWYYILEKFNTRTEAKNQALKLTV